MRFNKTFYFVGILVLLIYLIYRVIDLSQIITIFPIDTFANDRSSHIAKLFFLDKYGLHNKVPNWYNGEYQILKLYPPGWYIYALPLLKIFKSSQAAVYYSIILTFILGFIAFLILGGVMQLKLLDRIAMFLLFFANPLTIGYLLRLGKDPEMLSWVFVVLISALLLYYRNKILDYKFYLLFIILSTILFYVHLLSFIIAGFIMLAFFIIRNFKDKIKIFIAVLIIAALTSFFWYPFFTSIGNGIQLEKAPLKFLLSNDSRTSNDKLVAYVTPLMLFVLFYFYYKTNKLSKKDLLFFSIPLLVALLIFLRILLYVPIFNKIFPDTYSIFFILISLFFLFNINLDKLGKPIRILFNVALVIVPIIGVIISYFFTPFFIPHTPEVKSVLDLLPSVDGNFMTLWGSTVNGHAIYSYGAIYYNTKTSEGWDPTNLSKADSERSYRIYDSAKSKDCFTFKQDLGALNVKNLIVPRKEFCEPVICGLKLKKSNELSCLLEY